MVIGELQGVGQAPACAPEPSSLQNSILEGNLRAGGGCRGGWNLRVGIVGAVQFRTPILHQLQLRTNRRNILVRNRFLHVDNEVGRLGVLGVLRHSNLDLVGIGFDHDARDRRLLALKKSPELVSVFLAANGEHGFLIGQREGIQVRRGRQQVVDLFFRRLRGSDIQGSRREERWQRTASFSASRPVRSPWYFL